MKDALIESNELKKIINTQSFITNSAGLQNLSASLSWFSLSNSSSCFHQIISDQPTVHYLFSTKQRTSWWRKWSIQQLKNQIFVSGAGGDQKKVFLKELKRELKLIRLETLLK